MKITLLLLCLGVAPLSLASTQLDGGYINVDSLIEEFGNNNSPRDSINVQSNHSSYDKERSSLSSTYTSSTFAHAAQSLTLPRYEGMELRGLVNRDVIANGENITISNETLSSNARLIASNGGNINLQQVEIDLTTYSDSMYSLYFEDQIFKMDLSKIFTNDGSAEGGSYTGNLIVRMGDEIMRTLVATLATQNLGFLFMIGENQVLDLTTLTLTGDVTTFHFRFKEEPTIPEPSTASLSLLALSFLLIRRRRRRP